jgi:hypothetical protein
LQFSLFLLMTMMIAKPLAFARLVLFLVAVATARAAFFEPCNICRSPNVVRNKNASISAVVRIITFGSVRTCGDLDLLARTGWVSDRTCVRLQTRRWVRQACNCGQEGPPPFSFPTKQPTKAPIITLSPTVTRQPTITRLPSETRQPTVTAQPTITGQPTPTIPNPTKAPIKTKAPKKVKTKAPVPVAKTNPPAPVSPTVVTTNAPVEAMMMMRRM